MAVLKTLSPDNKFRIVCPVFHAEVPIASCFTLNHRRMRGERQEERRGCQACLKASKCPIPRIITLFGRDGHEDPYHSTEPKVGALKPAILEHIRPTIVHEPLLDEFGVPTSERELILAANEAASFGARAKVSAGKRQPIRGIELESVGTGTDRKIQQKPAIDADERAAITGDMSAAITKAVAAKAPVEPSREPESAMASSHMKAAPTPPAANVVNPVTKPAPKPTPAAPPTPGARPSLLELARQRRAAA